MRNVKAGLVVLGFILVVWALAYGWGWSKCSWYGYQTERTVRFSGSVGCMVKTNNGWALIREIRAELE